MDSEDERKKGGFSLAEATGGPLGIAESTLPFIAFTIVWTVSGKDVAAGAVVAVAIAAVLAGWRVLRRETVQFALSGLVGVAFGAFVAARTGEAKNFFLPGILINAASCIAYLTSIAIRRPLIGLLAAALTGEGRSWYEDPERRRLYTWASWIWVILFALRLCIQLPLYLTDSVGTLAAARVVTGLPLFALGLWFTYLVLRPILGERMLTRSP
jgi:intracellular septation protein A